MFNHLIKYPTPINLNYLWGFGFSSGFFFLIQILTGLLLSIHYVPNILFAFESIEHIMRDVNFGWFLRYLHSNGASFFFICLYSHILKNIFYRSYKYPRHNVWNSGIFVFILSIITAFIGYVLPWGQMSFWGATVITNLLTALPYIGSDLVFWIWGGFSIGNATLNRFFSFHFVLPFLVLCFIFVHLSLLHNFGSNNPLCIDSSNDRISFYPYYFIKDIFTFLVILIFYLLFVFYYPDLLGHSDNFIKADPLVTPIHIVPEWYFLPFHAILRSVPNKFFGVLLMLSSIFILFFLPYLDRSNYVISPKLNSSYEYFFWIFFLNILILGWLGSMPVEEPYLFFSRLSTFFYFFCFVFLYVFTVIENKIFNSFFVFKTK